jgi:hypothetical protein
VDGAAEIDAFAGKLRLMGAKRAKESPKNTKNGQYSVKD